MARRKQTRGTCIFCGRDFSRSGMTRHLQACAARKEAAASEQGEKEPVFHLQVQGARAPEYWMHLEIPAKHKLQQFDQFLRDIWLECCGHLSAITIDEIRYLVSLDPVWDYWGEKPESMDVPLSKVFSPGLKAAYEYDFGSTTPLTVHVISERQGTRHKKHTIRVLARNHPPDIPCARCGEKQATRIYVWEQYEPLCDRCGNESGYDDEGWLPVVNSPRVGECGYTGAEIEI